MERYEAYKDSGIEWIGKIPAGWETRRIKSIASYSCGSGIQRSEVVPKGKPCVRYGELYTTYSNRITKPVSFITEDLWESSTLVKPNELIMALTGETKEDIGPTCVNVSDHEIAASEDTLVIRSKGQECLFVMPPLQEQLEIASFLDAKTAEIDALIEAKRSMASKLREYRRSLISEAVTGKFKVPGV